MTTGRMSWGCLLALLGLTACGEDEPWMVGAGGAGTEDRAGSAGFPFPQNRESEFCVLPETIDNARVRQAYDKWKDELVTAYGASGFRRVMRPDTPDGIDFSTVSEGIAYGMLLAVYLDDQALFDDLWQYARLWADDSGLMNWYVDPHGQTACPERSSCGAATDADEDMAFALVMADRQWGGRGSLDRPYAEHALEHIGRVLEHEVVRQSDPLLGGLPLAVLRPGNAWGGYTHLNISYFAPAFYRVFAEVDTEHADEWHALVDGCYTIIERTISDENGNIATGLLPAWSKGNGTLVTDGSATHHQYDSARIPFRIGQDYCWHGDPRAKQYLDRITEFFVNESAAGIYDGYDLDGTPHPDEHASGRPSRSAVFVGSAAVGGMSDTAHADFVQEARDRIATLELLERSRYYNLSWTAMSLAMLSGNYWPLPGSDPED